jgi:hypothetical protein
MGTELQCGIKGKLQRWMVMTVAHNVDEPLM